MQNGITEKIGTAWNQVVKFASENPGKAVAYAVGASVFMPATTGTIVATGKAIKDATTVTCATVAGTAVATGAVVAATFDATTGHTISTTAGAVLGAFDATTGHTLSSAAAGTHGLIPPFI